MSNVTLYPELANYIFDYCTRFRTENETKALQHFIAMEKSDNGRKEGFYSFFKERNMVSDDAEVLKLLEHGFQTFKKNVVQRIYDEHKHELELNLCPKCYQIARTPQAKQCRFCFYNWH